MNSNDVSVGCDGEKPPDRQLLPPFGHTTSLAFAVSGAAMSLGEMMMELSSAPARKPAAVAVEK